MRVLQFTDPHLSGSPDMRVRGVATAATLARCVAHARRHHPRPDAVLLTGDLVHDDPAGYAVLRAQFADAGAPVHCLPGNHDDPADVTRRARRAAVRARLREAPRRLDVRHARQHGRRRGRRPPRRTSSSPDSTPRSRRSRTRTRSSACTTIPVPHGSAWLDELMLDNAAEFFAVLARHAGVRGARLGPYAPALRGHARRASA